MIYSRRRVVGGAIVCIVGYAPIVAHLVGWSDSVLPGLIVAFGGVFVAGSGLRR